MKVFYSIVFTINQELLTRNEDDNLDTCQKSYGIGWKRVYVNYNECFIVKNAAY